MLNRFLHQPLTKSLMHSVVFYLNQIYVKNSNIDFMEKVVDMAPASSTSVIQKIMEISSAIDLDESNLTTIQEFYKDAKIFVTGATGFLGQLLVEKLLRSCPVSKIYILIRDKKGKNVDTRLNQLFDDVVYKRLRKTNPNFRQKIVAVVGDCSLPNLGLTDQDIKMLIDDVNIVFHVAATVRFDEKLSKAAAINIRGTRDLSKMVQQMPKLKSFVHISTAFSNCDQEVIEEKVYPTIVNYDDLLTITESMDDSILEKLTTHFLEKYPNTYVLTKQIAEDVVKQETKGLPSGIFRPSMVISTYKEPIRGWINNFYGPIGISYSAAMGLVRVALNNNEHITNLVPVDMCVYGVMASAWDVAQKFQKSKTGNEKYEVAVYNYDSSNYTPITWISAKKIFEKYSRQAPPLKALWVDFLLFIKSYYVYLFLAFFLHTIPGAIVDTILFCRGKKMRMLQIYQKIHVFSKALSFFAMKYFHFESTNVTMMINSMCERDRHIFFCDLRELDWEEFYVTYWAGCRLYLAKESMETIPQAKKRRQRFMWANRAIAVILGSIVLVILWIGLSAIYRLVVRV